MANGRAPAAACLPLPGNRRGGQAAPGTQPTIGNAGLNRGIQDLCERLHLCSLGRLRNPQSLPVLIDFLDPPDWARYAADALGNLETDFSTHANLADSTIRELAYERWRPKPPDLVPRDAHFCDHVPVTAGVGFRVMCQPKQKSGVVPCQISNGRFRGS